MFWRSDASQDVLDALEWYESEAPSQVPRFLRRLRDAEQLIAAYPYMQRLFDGDFRRIPLKSYPYEIWYRLNESQQSVQILALKHERRDSTAYLRRLG